MLMPPRVTDNPAVRAEPFSTVPRKLPIAPESAREGITMDEGVEDDQVMYQYSKESRCSVPPIDS